MANTPRPAVHPDASILVVDDEPANVAVLKGLLGKAGYTQVRTATDAVAGLESWIGQQPDLLLLDIQMPMIDGFGFLAKIRPLVADGDYRPVLVLTADTTRETRDRALASGGTDFVTKPFDATEVLLRVANLLDTRHLHTRLERHNTLLEERVRERTRHLELARLETVERLARAVEFRDDDTGDHIVRVGGMSAMIAAELGQSPHWVARLQLAAAIHDVGKIAVPDQVLLKPGKLSPEEFELIKTHTVVGGRILRGSSSAVLQLAEEVALTHHERWDGFGYAGLAGETIPLSGRIVAVADVFDALTHVRPYKPAWTVDEALSELVEQRGRQFDPDVVDAFLRVADRPIPPGTPRAHAHEEHDHIHLA